MVSRAEYTLSEKDTIHRLSNMPDATLVPTRWHQALTTWVSSRTYVACLGAWFYLWPVCYLLRKEPFLATVHALQWHIQKALRLHPF